MADDKKTTDMTPMSAEQIKLLGTSKQLLDSLTDSLDNYNNSVSENLSSMREYISQLAQQSYEATAVSAAYGGLNEKLNVFDKILKTNIDLNEKLVTVLRDKLNKAFQDSIKLKTELNDLEKLEQKINEDKLIISDKLQEAEDKLNAAEKVRLDQAKKIIQDYTSINDLSQKERENLEKEIGSNKNLAEAVNVLIYKNYINNANTLKDIENRRQQIALQQEYNEEIKRSIPQELSVQEIRKLQNKATDDIKDSMTGLVNKLSQSSDSTNIFASALVSATGGYQNFSQAIKSGLTEAFLSPMAAMNRFFNFLNTNLVQSSFKFDENLAGINKKLGGMGNKFEEIAISKVGPFRANALSELSKYGVGLSQLGDAYDRLANKMGNFNLLSENQRRQLSVTAAQMENLGVSAENFASITSYYMGTIGKTAEGAKSTVEELARVAIGAGVDVGNFLKSFEQVMPKIVGFGREAIQIFKELNAFATATSGAVSEMDLQAIGEQFFHFDSAADSLSKLNAAFGGLNINIQEIMGKDPSIVVMKLKQAIDETGRSADVLNNPGMLRLVGEVFGDAGKAAAILRTETYKINEQLLKTAATREEMQKREKASVDAMREMKIAVENIQIGFAPLVKIVSVIAGWMADLNMRFKGFGGFLAIGIPLGIAAVKGAFTLLGSTIKSAFGGIFTEINANLTITQQHMAAMRAEMEMARGASMPHYHPNFIGPQPPPSMGGPAVPPAAPKTGMMGSFGRMALFGAIATATLAATSNSQQSAPERERQFLQDSRPQEVQTVEGADTQTRDPIFRFDSVTNALIPVANINKKDSVREEGNGIVSVSKEDERAAAAADGTRKVLLPSMERLVNHVREGSERVTASAIRIQERSETNNIKLTQLGNQSVVNTLPEAIKNIGPSIVSSFRESPPINVESKVTVEKMMATIDPTSQQVLVDRSATYSQYIGKTKDTNPVGIGTSLRGDI